MTLIVAKKKTGKIGETAKGLTQYAEASTVVVDMCTRGKMGDYDCDIRKNSDVKNGWWKNSCTTDI